MVLSQPSSRLSLASSVDRIVFISCPYSINFDIGLTSIYCYHGKLVMKVLHYRMQVTCAVVISQIHGLH